MRERLFKNDITIIPPPCMTPARAEEIYLPTFKRVVEYIENSRLEGGICEFGTFHGYTARTFAECLWEFDSAKHLYLYDSWEGFPAMESVDATCPEVAEHKTWKKGDCQPITKDAPELIRLAINSIIPGHVTTIQGFYNSTVAKNLPEKVAVAHIDCDLYTSTKLVLEELIKQDRLIDGAVILFDEFNNNNASDKYGERRAFKEISDEYKELCYFENWFTYGSSGYCFLFHKV